MALAGNGLVRRSRAVFLCLGLFAGVVAIYGQVYHFQFVWDDSRYVYENPHVRSGLTWPNAEWAFGVHPPSMWIPLTWLSHQFCWQMFGPHPAGHHLVNIVLHAVSAVLLFGVLYRMTATIWPSALVAALFAFHPLHVESVAWVTERKDVLCGLFWVLGLWAYRRYARIDRPGAYGLVVAAHALALMAKPLAVTFPFALLLFDYWPLRRSRWSPTEPDTIGSVPPCPQRSAGRLCLEKVPLLALSAVASVLTWLCQLESEAIVSLKAVTVGQRLWNAAVSYMTYLRQAIWPSDLAVFYPYPTSIVAWHVAVAVALLTGLTFLAVRWARSYPYLFVGWFWFLGVLVPMSQLVQVGQYSMANRYAYLPLIGIYAMVAWGFYDLARRWPWVKSACWVVAPIMLAACMVAAWRQAGTWRDSETLWTQALQVTANNDMAWTHRGNEYAKRGQPDRAIEDFDQAIKLKPGHADAYIGRGGAYNRKGQYDRAVHDLDRAVELAPDHEMAYNNRGLAYVNKGQYDRAIKDLDRAIELAPDLVLAYINRGWAYTEKRQYDRAIEDLDRAIELQPDNAIAYSNRGWAHTEKRQYDRAITDLDKAIELEPGHAMVYNNRGWAYANKRQYSRAIQDFNKAIELKPDLVIAYRNRAEAQYRVKDYDRAWKDVRTVQKLRGAVDPRFLEDLRKVSGRNK